MYGENAYWNDRYTKEAEEFEWYQSYDHIKDKIKAAFPDKSGKVLNLGCGSSRLAGAMYTDPDGGYKNVTSVDFSDVVISAMKNKHPDKPELEFKVADVRNLKSAD